MSGRSLTNRVLCSRRNVEPSHNPPCTAPFMTYNELIQLYFERANAMQQYWNLYVIIVGGILAFSSLRKQPAAITTALVCILFALFAYNNLDAMYDTTQHRFATLHLITEFKSSEGAD